MLVNIQNSENPRVSIIIISSIRRDLLLPCLRSLEEFGPTDIAYEVIVVLNEVAKDAEATLNKVAPGIIVCRSEFNLGFAGANNRGRALCRGEYMVTLNDDVEIESGWLEALVRCADARPEAGAVGGMVLHFDGRLQNAGMVVWQDAITSPPWVGEAPPPATFDRVRAVDYCGTNSLLVRSNAWDRLGGLDERYFPLYYTDVDFCMALREIGLVTLFQPAARVRHHRGASTTSHFKPFISARNRGLFMEKWGDKLEEYEPPDRGSSAGVERAVARAERMAELVTQSSCNRVPDGFIPIELNLQEHERRQLERAYIVQREYAKHLEAMLDAKHANTTLFPAAWRSKVPFVINDRVSCFRLLSGFSHPEAWGVWTVGARAEFMIQLPQNRDIDLVARFEVVAFVPHDKPTLSVDISVNGRQPSKWLFNMDHPEGLEPTEITLPARITRNQHVVFALDIDSPRSPADCRVSEDGRQLGVGFKALTLIPSGKSA